MFKIIPSHRCYKSLRTVVASALMLLWPAMALADTPIPGAKPVGHADVLPGVLVFFGVVLGLILVCRSSNRSPDMKLEELEDE